MSFAEFRELIAQNRKPSKTLGPAVLALWHDARGDWEASHEAAQNDPSHAGAWVHAYLHRKEGDEGNAGYWYARAARPRPTAQVPFDSEWAEIAQALLAEKANGARDES